MATSKAKKPKTTGIRGGKRPNRADLTGEPVGRPPAINEDVLRKLTEGFALGLTDAEACLYADVGTTAFYSYCAENPEFSEKKEILKGKPLMHARANVAKAVAEGDQPTSKWMLERRSPDFNPTQNIAATVTITERPSDLTGVLIGARATTTS